MADGSLIFKTALDNGGFKKNVESLKKMSITAATAITVAFSGAAVAAANVGASFTAAMSQVSATMGIDRASEEYKLLSARAEEMGAATKFSATQAGEALNYLALAGYDAQKSVAALPTVLDLAAAGGIDLAYSSDMVTDSMSALGLGMDELTSFADKLAKTSQKSNTSVAQLGEAILTVGGTARNLSGGVTELNTMLGLIADNGIKGAEGGTALRNIILALSAPTDTAAEALAALNIEAYDSSGKLRSLIDIFADFNSSLEPLTEQERSQVLSKIFNVVDLKAVNALLGTSSKRFAELSKYIEDSNGAAAQMSQTMSDNLTGDMDNLSSAAEGLGITIFQKFETPMRTAVVKITDVISELNTKLGGETGDKLEVLAEKIGDVAVRAAEFAANDGFPVLIDGLEWVCDNSDELITAAEAAGAMVIAYKGLTVAKTAASAVNTFATACKSAAAAQGGLNIVLSVCPWVAVGTLAIGAGVALADYIDKQKELIGYEGEIKEGFNEANEEIALQINALDKLSQTDPYAAYKESAEGLDETENKIKAADDRLTELYNKRQQINISRDNLSDVTDPYLMDELNQQLDTVEQEIEGLEDQLKMLSGLRMVQRKIANEYSASYNGAAVAAENYKRKVIEMNESGRTADDIISDIMSRRSASGLQADTSANLGENWDELNHEYAMGIIKSDTELYNKRLALLNKYGDDSNTEHWSYYEALADYEQEQHDKAVEAEKEKNDKILSDTQDRLRSQLDTVKKGLSKTVSEYDTAMSELESNISGYKNKLLSVGDVFTVSETEKDGVKIKNYTIENIEAQMEQMKKYHKYVKELKASGASQGLLEELTSLDFDDGTEFGRYLTGLSDSEFANINEYYKQRDMLADELSQDLYQGEAEKLNNTLMTCIDNALMLLPETARNAGKEMLNGIIAGLSDDAELTDEINSFIEGFSEVYESAVNDMDLSNGFAVMLGGIDTYTIGQGLALELTKGFNDELKKSQSDIAVLQTQTAADLSSEKISHTARSTGKPDKITVDSTTNISLELDGDLIAQKIDKHRTEKERRTG